MVYQFTLYEYVGVSRATELRVGIVSVTGNIKARLP